MNQENMKRTIIASLNGKLKDNIKAGDLVEEIFSKVSFEKDKYVAATKISKENAEKELEKILLKHEIAELDSMSATLILSKIMFGKLYIDESKGELIFELTNPINDGSDSLKKKFTIQSPSQAALTENDIDIMKMGDAKGNIHIDSEMMSRAACLFLGIPVAFSKQIFPKDVNSVFSLGMLLFFGG